METGMKVYHWTTNENAQKILKSGLKAWSFVCRNIEDWNGETCLEISLPYNIDWDSRDEYAKWQAVVPEIISPKFIKRIVNGN